MSVSENDIHCRTNRNKQHIRENLTARICVIGLDARICVIGLDARKFSCAKISMFTVCFLVLYGTFSQPILFPFLEIIWN